MQDWQNGGFGVYVHWPFCASKCPYCDFNSHVRDRVDQTAWKSALLFEINRLSEQTPDRTVRSVFFGGGTPSLMEPDVVQAVIQAIRSAWPTTNNLEITLEANPGSVEAGRFRAYSEAGVTRVSMGVQALNDADLKTLGRLHSVADARRAFDIACNVFDAVSFDLIYARQNQTAEAWRAELAEALDMAVDHLSLYQLTIEPGTAFGARHAVGKLSGLPADEQAATMYEMTQELCADRGLPAYEVSNHAREGATCAHNLVYWRGGDYVGVGPGAHGRLTLGDTRYATEAIANPESWLQAVRSAGSGELPRTALSAQDRANEYLMMSLRLAEGTSLDRFEDLGGVAPDAAALRHLEDIGMVSVENGQLRTTLQGRLLLNAVIAELLAG